MKSPQKILFVIVILLVGACSQKGQQIVRVGDTVITRRAFIQYLQHNGVTYSKLDYSLKLSMISNMIRSQVLLADARKAGFYEDPGILATFETQKRRLLSQTVLDDAAGHSTARYSAGDLRKFTAIMQIRLIWIDAPLSLDPSVRNAGLIKAKTCLSKVNIKNFSEIADSFSESPLNFRGGGMGAHRLSDLQPALQAVVPYLTSGSISGPIVATNGVYLIRLDHSDVRGAERIFILSGILLKYPGGGGSIVSVNRERILSQARMIHSLLDKDPKIFADLANQYSEDPSNRLGGAVRDFSYDSLGSLIVPEAAWKTGQGHISGIIENRSGFLIMLVDKITFRKNAELRPLMKNKAQFANVCKHIANLKTQYLRELNIQRYVDFLYSHASVVHDYSVFTNRDPDSVSTPSLAVVKFLQDSRTITFKDYMDTAEVEIPGGAAKFKNYKQRVNWFENRFVYPELVYLDALKHRLAERPSQAAALKTLIDDLVLSRYTSDLIAHAPMADDTLQAFYLARPGKFKAPFAVLRQSVKSNYLIENRMAMINSRFSELLAGTPIKIFSETFMNKREKIEYEALADAAALLKKKSDMAAALSFIRAVQIMPDKPEPYLELFSLYESTKDLLVKSLVKKNLAQMKPMSITAYIPLLDDPARCVKTVELFAEWDSREVIPSLNSRLSTSNRELKIAIVSALGSLHSLGSSDQILNIIIHERQRGGSSTNNALLSTAIHSLGTIANKEAIDYLEQWLLSGPVIEIQCLILDALGSTGEPSVIPVLREFAKNGKPGVRLIAARSLKSLVGDREVMDVQLKGTNSKP